MSLPMLPMPEVNTDNPAVRVPVALLLDTSGSMVNDPIEALNAGVRRFKEEGLRSSTAASAIELMIVTFGGQAKVAQEFTDLQSFTPEDYVADGLTPMGEALSLGFDRLQARKSQLKENGIKYYQPMMFVITDGRPEGEDPSAWRAAIDRISPEVRNNKLTFFAIATGAADEAKLGEIASPARVKRLSGQSWDALFAWIAQSADAVAKSDGTTQRVTYPSTDPWAGQNATPQ